MEKPPGKGGRPPGREHTFVKTLRLRPDDVERLRALAVEWGCSEAAVVRRLLQEEGKRRARRGQSGRDSEE